MAIVSDCFDFSSNFYNPQPDISATDFKRTCLTIALPLPVSVQLINYQIISRCINVYELQRVILVDSEFS